MRAFVFKLISLLHEMRHVCVNSRGWHHCVKSGSASKEQNSCHGNWRFKRLSVSKNNNSASPQKWKTDNSAAAFIFIFFFKPHFFLCVSSSYKTNNDLKKISKITFQVDSFVTAANPQSVTVQESVCRNARPPSVCLLSFGRALFALRPLVWSLTCCRIGQQQQQLHHACDVSNQKGQEPGRLSLLKLLLLLSFFFFF